MSPTRRSSNELVEIKKIPTDQIKMLEANSQDIVEIIHDLPIQLPKDRNIFFRLNSGTVNVWSDVGFDEVVILNSSKVGSVEYTPDQINVKLKDIRGVTLLSIVTQAKDLPVKGVTTLANADAPVDLIDQYSMLKAKSNRNAEEERQLTNLLKQIGNEFRKRQDRSSIPSRSSTSYTGGESRGSIGSRYSG